MLTQAFHDHTASLQPLAPPIHLFPPHLNLPSLLAVGPAFASKLVGVSMGHRPTFSDALGYANTHLSGQVVVLLNADIFLDHSIARLWPPKAVDLDRRVCSNLTSGHYEPCQALVMA